MLICNPQSFTWLPLQLELLEATMRKKKYLSQFKINMSSLVEANVLQRIMVSHYDAYCCDSVAVFFFLVFFCEKNFSDFCVFAVFKHNQLKVAPSFFADSYFWLYVGPLLIALTTDRFVCIWTLCMCFSAADENIARTMNFHSKIFNRKKRTRWHCQKRVVTIQRSQ